MKMTTSKSLRSNISSGQGFSGGSPVLKENKPLSSVRYLNLIKSKKDLTLLNKNTSSN